MLEDEMKKVLIRYLFTLGLYLVISVFLKSIPFDKVTFIIINIVFAILFLVTYIKYNDK